jgi:hypothetical protein
MRASLHVGMAIVAAALSGSASAASGNFGTLLAPGGWERVGDATSDATGAISIDLKVVDGNRCLRGVATVDAPAASIYDVVTDIESAPRWVTAKLIASEMLGNEGEELHYYQHLSVPAWTMASDRYWVLRGWPASSGDTLAFQWDRFDWRTRYPVMAERADRDFKKAVEPTPNFGSWVVRPTPEGKTLTHYYICSDPGGSIPEWLAKAAATKTLPETMADVVREAAARAAR